MKAEGVAFRHNDARRLAPDFHDEWFGHDFAPPAATMNGRPVALKKSRLVW